MGRPRLVGVAEPAVTRLVCVRLSIGTVTRRTIPHGLCLAGSVGVSASSLSGRGVDTGVTVSSPYIYMGVDSVTVSRCRVATLIESLCRVAICVGPLLRWATMC